MNRTANLVCTLALMLLGANAHAADKWAVGVNTMFVQEYLLSLGIGCPSGTQCPSNAQSHTLSQIQAIVSDLVVNQHVGTFRESVPFALLSPYNFSNPSGTPMLADMTNWPYIDQIMSLFRMYNVHVILTVGNPIPPWAQVAGGGDNVRLLSATAQCSSARSAA